MTDSISSNDIVADLRARYECTAGYTRDIYTPEHRDLDVRAADEIERLRRHLRQKSDQISRLQDAVQSHQAGTAERTALEPCANCETWKTTLEATERDRKRLELRVDEIEEASQPPGVSPLAVYAYAMTERHLSGYRLILGFDTLSKVQDAHKEVADLAVMARDALTKGSAT